MICPLCKGKGEIPIRRIKRNKGKYKLETCVACNGTGKVKIKKTKKNIITIIEPDEDNQGNEIE